MIPGTTITLGPKKYLCPPLNFLALKKHSAFLARVLKGDIDPTKLDGDEINTIFDLVYLALKRNYPELAEAEVAEFLDVGNITVIMPVIMKTSGFEDKVSEDKAPGE